MESDIRLSKLRAAKFFRINLMLISIRFSSSSVIWLGSHRMRNKINFSCHLKIKNIRNGAIIFRCGRSCEIASFCSAQSKTAPLTNQQFCYFFQSNWNVLINWISNKWCNVLRMSNAKRELGCNPLGNINLQDIKTQINMNWSIVLVVT